ncbi:hypothetical protein [Altererythrobacter lauratis]|uniref:Uncharacterized protein n=1 Tax=Alteraurantiacibacter lauratis TaxID=2054627 RepID=A0ABV7ED22_9SPHN
MPSAPSRPSREEILAAKLRENLKRRKVQARALAADLAPDGSALPKGESNG